jgi:DNA-binding NtrC family response regulator
MPWLSIIAGPGAGQRYELRSRTTIGRDAANQVQIADPKSSRIHAEVASDGGRFHVRDLDSSNGTWTEDGRISSLPLIHGSEFRIGATRFRFESVQDPAAGEWADPVRIEGLDQHKTVLFTQAADADVDVSVLARTNAYLVLLHHLIRRSNAAPDRDALFELLDDAAAEVLEGDRCAVFLPAPAGVSSGWSLWPAHERRLRARFGAVPFARTLLTAVRSRGEPLLCTSDGDLAPSASMVQAGVQSAMAAPVRIGDAVQALLYVDRLTAVQPFTRTDLEFLAAVANQMAARLSSRSASEAALADGPRETTVSAPVVEVLGDDPALVQVREQALRLADVTLPVLITGEVGTGKELLARFIHAHSRRSGRPFQLVTCAALDDQGAEVLLFGRAQGAGTPGIFELADGGTIFFDELSDLPPSVQARVLRVIETGEVQRPGLATLHRVDVRLIAASTGQPQKSAVLPGLTHVFAGKSLVLPPLRERAGDIEVLTHSVLDHQAATLHQAPKRLSSEARAVLLRHSWPGNVRELRQVIERAFVMANGVVITPADLPDFAHAAKPTQPTAGAIEPLAVVERAHILRVLDYCDGNKKAAAELLEIDRSTLYAKLKQYGVG